MILIDVIDAERRKIVAALTPAGPEPGPSRRPATTTTPPAQPSSIEPPDYETSQKEIEKLKVTDIEKVTNRGQRRLRRYLVYGLVIYLVLSLSIGIPLFIMVCVALRLSLYVFLNILTVTKKCSSEFGRGSRRVLDEQGWATSAAAFTERSTAGRLEPTCSLRLSCSVQ